MGKQTDLFKDEGDSQPTRREASPQPEQLTVKVEILIAAQSMFTKKEGKEFCKLVAKDVDPAGMGTISLTCFGSAVHAAKNLVVGSKVTVTGKKDDREDKGIFVYSFHIPGSGKTISKKARIIREHGSLEAYRESEARNRDAHLEAGRVLVKRRDDKGVEWVEKSDCVQHLGEWKRKIDALMDHFGAGLIKNEIQSLVSKEPEVTLAKGKSGFYRSVANWNTRYKEWTEKKVREMQGNTAEVLFK